jgi:dinuclear metal center YbgI/SA1388 family protein
VAVSLQSIQEYLDTLLRTREIADESNALNGLQVENSGEITGIVAAVDASQATIDQVASRFPGQHPLLLVHHGLFWDGNIPATGRRFRRLRALITGDIALYSSHIPLDLHPRLGNNIALAELIGLRVDGWFGKSRGEVIGVFGALHMDRDELVHLIDSRLETRSMLIRGGPAMASRLGIITGGAGSMIGQARDAGLDTFVTGEGAHHTFFDATESGLNVIYAGHYATEKLGVQRLARHLAETFGLPWEFHEHDTQL